MTHLHQRRRRTPLTLRRSILLDVPVPPAQGGRALIVRWIGAAARKRRKTSSQDARCLPASDNVTRLAWAQTFGRETKSDSRQANSTALVLAMRSGEKRSRD